MKQWGQANCDYREKRIAPSEVVITGGHGSGDLCHSRWGLRVLWAGGGPCWGKRHWKSFLLSLVRSEKLGIEHSQMLRYLLSFGARQGSAELSWKTGWTSLVLLMLWEQKHAKQKGCVCQYVIVHPSKTSHKAWSCAHTNIRTPTSASVTQPPSLLSDSRDLCVTNSSLL